MSDALKSSLGSLFIQKTPGKNVEYLGCADLDPITQPTGDVALIQCRDRDGNYVTVGKTKSPPGAVTSKIGSLKFPEKDVLDELNRCPWNVYAMQRLTGKAGVLSNFVRGYIILWADVTSQAWENIVRRVDDTETTHGLDISGINPVVQVREVNVVRQDISETRALNDVVADLQGVCGNESGGYEDPGTDAFAVSDGQTGSPITDADLWKTTDGGENWVNATSVVESPFASGYSAISLVRFQMDKGNWRLLTARGGIAGQSAQVSYSDDNGATWHRVTVGSISLEGANNQGALFALDKEHIWFATSIGNVYKSSDGGLTWTIQNAPTATTGTPLNVIKFCNSQEGYAAGNSDRLLKTLDGGVTWFNATVVPTSADNLTAMHVWSRDRLIIGSNAGEVFETWDGASSWESKSYTGQAATDSIADFEFVNEVTGYMLQNPTASGSGFVHRTIDGGASFDKLPTPPNGGLNAIAIVGANKAYVVGEVQSGTAVVLKVNG